jgi:hypothetical protein
MFTDQELLKLWSNDQKRRAFVQNYKTWGVWFSQSELGLTFYKYELSDAKIIVMEYMREPYFSEKPLGNNKGIVCRKFYLQRGAFFSPDSVSDHVIAEHLKKLKEKMAKGEKRVG